jgi:hypothetical protein
MTFTPRKLETTLCPTCSSATILIWARKVSTSTSSLPLCKTCFVELKKTSRKKSSKYQLHFAPKLIHSEPDTWIVSPERQYDFRELKLFIDQCLSQQNRDSDADNFITKDKDVLVQLVDLLCCLVPNLTPHSFEEFKSINEFQIAPSIPKKRQELLTEVLDARTKLRYEKYLNTFKRIHQKELQKLELRRRIAARLRNEVLGIGANSHWKGAKKVFCQMLPPGKHPFAYILNHFRSLQYNPGIRYDETRLEKIYGLGPTATYVGTDEFKGYVAFYFEDLHLAVLDCHRVGNAVYVMEEDWQSLSQLSKAALLLNYSDNVERIIHTDRWFQRLRSLLYNHGWRPSGRHK